MRDIEVHQLEPPTKLFFCLELCRKTLCEDVSANILLHYINFLSQRSRSHSGINKCFQYIKKDLRFKESKVQSKVQAQRLKVSVAEENTRSRG